MGPCRPTVSRIYPPADLHCTPPLQGSGSARPSSLVSLPARAPSPPRGLGRGKDLASELAAKYAKMEPPDSAQQILQRIGLEKPKAPPSPTAEVR
jgi:hypothetical protein